MEDAHCNIAFLNTSDGALNFFVEDVGKIGECCDEVADCVIITGLSILIVLLHINLVEIPEGLNWLFRTEKSFDACLLTWRSMVCFTLSLRARNNLQ